AKTWKNSIKNTAAVLVAAALVALIAGGITLFLHAFTALQGNTGIIAMTAFAAVTALTGFAAFILYCILKKGGPAFWCILLTGTGAAAVFFLINIFGGELLHSAAVWIALFGFPIMAAVFSGMAYGLIKHRYLDKNRRFSLTDRGAAAGLLALAAAALGCVAGLIFFGILPSTAVTGLSWDAWGCLIGLPLLAMLFAALGRCGGRVLPGIGFFGCVAGIAFGGIVPAVEAAAFPWYILFAVITLPALLFLPGVIAASGKKFWPGLLLLTCTAVLVFAVIQPADSLAQSDTLMDIFHARFPATQQAQSAKGAISCKSPCRGSFPG
ncbi:MAG: hypothetical protein FWE80_05085, partial [Oscillospiraceae bacterium]|nr:hypothetical protein [Oscillospiraceae bacterium]